MSTEWKLFRAPGEESATPPPFPAPPPWRNFAQRDHRADTFRPTTHEIEMVNAALYLRRPLLVTGKPGTGKSSLIYAVAKQLGLGPVLVWPITSRSTVRAGLYEYDAIGRLRAPSAGREADAANEAGAEAGAHSEPEDTILSQYLSLGPLGTALLPSDKPRALLIDEIDKADVDFPNDLLHVFEEGSFEISEARRIRARYETVRVRRSGVEGGSDDLEPIKNGQVQCTVFPFVVLTSNGERDLPAAFLRRCLRLRIDPPDETQLRDIIKAHFPEVVSQPLADEIDALVAQIADLNKDPERVVATDQLLSAIHIIRGERAPVGEERKSIVRELLREIGKGQ